MRMKLRKKMSVKWLNGVDEYQQEGVGKQTTEGEDKQNRGNQKTFNVGEIPMRGTDA